MGAYNMPRLLIDLGLLIICIMLALTLAGSYQIAAIVATVLVSIGMLMSYAPAYHS